MQALRQECPAVFEAVWGGPRDGAEGWEKEMLEMSSERNWGGSCRGSRTMKRTLF